MGSNEEAARRAGINVNRVKTITYIFSGLLAALVGIILASRMTTSQPNSAIGYEMNAIAAAVIGGTSLMGGVGTIGGTVHWIFYHRNTYGGSHHARRELLHAADRYRPRGYWRSND